MEDTPATRERILHAALDLFASRGYQRTSVREIADRVGVTKAAVHYHFPRKIDMMLAIAEPVWHDFETVIATAEAAPDPRWPALEGWLDALLKHRYVFQMISHDPSMLAHEPTYTRAISLAKRTMTLIAGPDPSLGMQVRAAQALGMLGDPILYFPDAPAAQLCHEILEGVRRLLGDPQPPDTSISTANGTTEIRRLPGEAPPSGPDQNGSASGVRRLLGEAQPGDTSVPADNDGTAGGRHGRGRRGPGRPPALTAENRLLVRRMHAEGWSAEEIATELAVSRATVYRHLTT